jgi:hypothetical protein
MKRWQDWANLVLGSWMVISPWALGFADPENPAALSAWLLGVAIVVFAGAAVSMPRAWEEGINIFLGAALVASPWVLDFAGQMTARSNAVAVGVLVAALALWALMNDPAFREKVFQRQQTR